MQAKQWMDSGVSASDSFHIAVNISVDQLQSYQIVETVKQALDQSGLPPHCLELEITESHYMDQLELSLQHLVALREIGVQVAIDDFGTGHSSLAYLLHLPIDILKIDKCFIDHIPDNPQDLFLAETILSIGERLKLKVVAEGVEHEKQLQWLKQVGCDQVQGYLFSRPLSVTEFEQWVIEHQENLK
jgi:EAL domain-containing protein (putative c-di-GMP-specific phosphodiesterase class I)